MTGSEFVKAMLWRLAILVALVLGASFAWMLAAAACGLCGMLVMMLTEGFGRRIIAVLFIISLASPTAKRFSSLGVPSAAGLVLPLLAAAEWPTLAHFGLLSMVNAGIRNVAFPAFALLALSIATWLTLGTTEPSGRPWQRHPSLWWAAVVGTGVSVVLGLPASAIDAVILPIHHSGLPISFLRAVHLLRAVGVATALVTTALVALLIAREKMTPEGPSGEDDALPMTVPDRANQVTAPRRAAFGRRRGGPL